MSEHALLSASSAERWSTCAASLRLDSAYPETSSKYADEGTAAHKVAAWCLSNNAMPDQYPDPAVEVNGVQWPVTLDMKNHVATYLQVVREHAQGGQLLVEQLVDYSDWIDVSDSFGTSDAVILHDEKLTIVDLKYGQGVQVYAYETDAEGKPQVNPQLALYALGCLYEYEHLGDFRDVKMIIVQPRLSHVSVCEIDVTSLKTFALNMKAAARRAMDVYESVSEPTLDKFAPSEKSCKWCRAKATCPALAANIETETRDLFGALVEHGGEAMAAAVPEDRLAQAMSKVGLLEDFCKAIRSETERRLLAGHAVPGWKLVAGRAGSRKWASDEAMAKARGVLVRKLGTKDALQPAELISPTEAEKRLKAIDDRAYDKLLAKYVERADGKPSVAPASDKRPALSITSAEEKFAGLLNASAEDLV